VKFEKDLPHCVRNVTTTNILLFKFRCNIFIGVWIIKEMQGSVASGTPCITDKVDINNLNIVLVITRKMSVFWYLNLYSAPS
jgi:hypothetical protein